MSASIGNLLSSANITSSVNVEAFLSSEYDSDGGDTLGQSLEQSGDFLSSEPPTPGIRTSAQLTQKGVEISELERAQRKERRRDAEIIGRLQQENEALRRAAAAAEAQTAEDLKSYRDAVESATARSRNELTELRAKLTALTGEMPAMRQKLAAGKASFAQLLIDEPRYQGLRACADEDLSVVEHVQMRVHELIASAERKSATVASREAGVAPGGGPLGELLAAERAAKSAVETRLAEAQARAEAKSAMAEEARIECRRLQAELSAAQATPEGAVRGKLEVAEAKISAMGEAAAEKEKAVSELSDSLAKAKKEAEEEGRKAGYLLHDKEYLTIQCKSLEDRLAVSESRLSKEEAQCAEAQAQLAVAKEALVSTTRDAAEEYKRGSSRRC